MHKQNYPIIIRCLSEEDGGGYLALAPDLPGCMSDGEDPVEAVSNLLDAMVEWIDEAEKSGLSIPKPGCAATKAKEKYDLLVNLAERQQKVMSCQDELLSSKEEVIVCKDQIIQSLQHELEALKAAIIDLDEAGSFEIGVEYEGKQYSIKSNPGDSRSIN